MKKYLFLLLSAAMFAFVGCTNDDLAGGTVGADEESKDVFYLDISMSQPAATRSKTDNDGKTNSDAEPDYEYGYDYESAVSEVLLVFTTTDDKLIFTCTASNIVESPDYKPSNDFQFTAKSKVTKTVITDEYKTSQSGTKGLLEDSKIVRVYAFCNPTQGLRNAIGGSAKGETTWIDAIGTVEESADGTLTGTESYSIWSKRSFLMSNAKIKEAELPATEDGWKDYSNIDNPFHLSKENTGGIDNRQGTGTEKRGPIYVERTAARIDFRDASGDLADAHDNPYTYKLYGTGEYTTDSGSSSEAPTTSDPNLFDVELKSLSLVNMSKKFYYLRRVSDTGTNTGWVVGGVERGVGVDIVPNYVVDTDYATKATGYTPVSWSDYSGAFSHTLFAEAKTAGNQYDYNKSEWYTTSVSKIAENPNDTWEHKEIDGKSNHGGEYHIWRYVTENTIPQADKQLVVQSVGIVFKGEISLGADAENAKTVVTKTDDDGTTYEAGVPFVSEAVKEAFAKVNTNEGKQNSPALYSFGGLIYAGFKDVTTTAVNNGQGGIAEKVLGHWYLVTDDYDTLDEVVEGQFTYSAEAPTTGKVIVQLTPAIYNEIMQYTTHTGDGKNWSTGFTVDDKLDESLASFKKLLTDENVTIYNATQDGDDWGYYCYYFYWNRHNDNGVNSEMGPMEFATVRNNVYKLAVTKLSRLGRPENPDNDPDPFDPGTPDETNDAYFDVQIVVLPWVVRVNDIEF